MGESFFGLFFKTKDFRACQNSDKNVPEEKRNCYLQGKEGMVQGHREFLKQKGKVKLYMQIILQTWLCKDESIPVELVLIFYRKCEAKSTGDSGGCGGGTDRDGEKTEGQM